MEAETDGGTANGVTLLDALAKIRELKAHEREVIDRYEERITQLEETITADRAEYLQQVKKIQAACREREQEAIDLMEGMQKSIRERAALEAHSEIQACRTALELAQNKAEGATEELEALKRVIDDRQSKRDSEEEVLEAEIKLLKLQVVQQAEEICALKQALARERELVASEREEWEKKEAQLIAELQGSKEKAAKAQLNTRWVEAMQMSLKKRNDMLRCAAAASDLYGELLAGVRQTFGVSAVDGVLHRTLASGSTLGKALETGVDVAALLSSALVGFDVERALGRLPPPRRPSASPPPSPKSGRLSAHQAHFARAQQLQREAEMLRNDDDDETWSSIRQAPPSPTGLASWSAALPVSPRRGQDIEDTAYSRSSPFPHWDGVMANVP